MSAAPFLVDPNQHDGTIYSPVIATDIATLQNAIIARLKAAQAAGNAGLAKLEIAAFPDNPKSWRLVNQVGAVLVKYEQAEYSETEDVGAIVQARKLEYQIAIAARGLGWIDATGVGAMAIIEGVRVALTGYAIPGCTKMYPTREAFVARDEQGGVFYYEMIFAMTTWVAEQIDSYTLPNLLQGSAIVADGSASDTVVATAADNGVPVNS